MIEAFIGEWLVELILFILGVLSTAITYYIKKVRNMEEDIDSLSQTIYGEEKLDNDGHIKNTNESISELSEELNHIDDKTDDIQRDISNIDGKLDILVESIDTDVNHQTNFDDEENK